MIASKAHAVRWAALSVGGALMLAALYNLDLRSIGSMRGLIVAVPFALAVSGLWHVVRTWAWTACFPPPRRVGFWQLIRVRLAAEAFSYLTLRGIAGEPLKVVLLNDRVDARAVTAAVALERLAYVAGTTMIVGMASLIAILGLPLSAGWLRVFRGFAIAAGLTTLLTAMMVGGRGGYLTALLIVWDRWFGASIANGRAGRFVSAVESHMLSLVRGNSRRLAILMTATLVCYGLMILEAWLILRSCCAFPSMTTAVAVETFSRVASFASLLIPANLGALEASSVAAAVAAGVGAAGGALALTRRIRGLFWAAVGMALYPSPARAGVLEMRADAGSTDDGRIAPTAVLYVMRDSRVPISAHVRLAGLPLSERVLRAALRAHADPSVLMVWMGERSDSLLREELARERSFERTVAKLGSRIRVIRNVEEWRVAVRGLQSVTVIGPGTLVSSALFEAAERQPVPPGAIVDVPAGHDWPVSGVIRMRGSDAADILRLTHVLRSRMRAKNRPSGEDVSMGRALLALRIMNEGDVPHAEQNLRRSTYKCTDAKIARFNRKLSIPVSVQLIRTGLTANQLSVTLVALGFYSAWLFSRGDYLSGVFGAFLSLVASVLDGCDGEIARLKYQESALGCWIETIGDYSYYIAVFVGLTIGAVRQTGWDVFSWMGAVALAGTLVSFALLIYLRSRITNGQPDRLHAIAKARFKAEPTVWSRIIWRVSFVATRAAMPYGIMVLAIVNLLPLVVFLAAVGTNVYWISLVLKLRDLLGSEEALAA
jgi:phosphatidylglycerophosphate synthase